MGNKVWRIGSRESMLAVAQTKLVMERLKKAFPDVELELITMKTTGDKILNQALDKIGGKGLFVKELDKALADGEIDMAVHSLKDMPMEENAQLPLAAVVKRGDPRDALVLGRKESGVTVIGTSSLRRRIQLEGLAAKCGASFDVKNVRGNVISRLAKLDGGEYGALILASAGLERLGLSDRVSRYFSVEEMIPAAGQGTLAIQTRKDFDIACLEAVNDTDTQIAALAERAFVRALDGGCSAPTAAFAQVNGQELGILGLYCSEKTGVTRRGSVCGDIRRPEYYGEWLAWKLKNECE